MKKSESKSPNRCTATIKDLAPEQKQRIGELVKRLAQQKALREEYQTKYEDMKAKFEQLTKKYETQLTQKEEQNRFLKLGLKNSQRRLQKSIEQIRIRKSNSREELGKRQVVQQSIAQTSVQQKPQLVKTEAPFKTEQTPPMSKSKSKRLEIEQLKRQIQQLQKSVHISPIPSKNALPDQSQMITQSSPVKKPDKEVRPDKIQQYELIKSRYTNIVNRTFTVDDSFQCPPQVAELPDTPTLPQPMTFVKAQAKIPDPNIDVTQFMDTQNSGAKAYYKPTPKSQAAQINQYQTQRVQRIQPNNSILSTVKKGIEARGIPGPRIKSMREHFYSSDLLDLVDSLDA